MTPPATPTPSSSASTRPRRGYIDWLRGLAVVIMIEAHTFDAWTAQPSRETLTFWYVQLIAGWGAPIFLFLAGVSVALASGAKVRKGADAFEASRAMIRRGGQIFLLALLFRIQAWLLSPGATLYGILKVDILNIMGPAIAGAALVWGLLPRTLPRLVALGAITGVLGLLTPIVRHAAWLAVLPDPIEWYLRPWAGRTTFTFFPWAGFVFAGAAVGELLDRVHDTTHETRMNLAFGLVGAAIAGVAFGASYLPSPYAQSYFWTSSPSFFFLRVGLLFVFLALAYLWSLRPSAVSGTTTFASPLIQFGRTSLFVYWIHVEMVYGILSYPLHRALTLPQALVAYVLFAAAMFALSVWKTRIVERWRQRGDRGAPAHGSTLLVTGGRSGLRRSL
jgi:uncharacterized membrane protein